MPIPDGCSPEIFTPAGRLRPDLFHPTTLLAIREGVAFARSTRWDSVRSPHLFMGLLSVPDAGVSEWGERLGADLPRLLDQFRDLFYQEHGDPEAALDLQREFLSDNVLRLLRESVNRAIDHGRPCVTPMDLLITMFTTPHSIVAECFERIGVTAARLTELAVMAEQAARRS
jgi:ATP-dependent Clp protease ATP-binding subunit ClpA